MARKKPAKAKKATTPNAKKSYEVSRADLPVSCPTPEMSLWNSHPKVFLRLEETGRDSCPYCGAEYVVTD